MSAHESGARFGEWEAVKSDTTTPPDQQHQRHHHHIHRQSQRPISHQNRGGDPSMYSLAHALSPEPHRISPLSHANLAAHTRALESRMTPRPSPRPIGGGSPPTPRPARMFDPFARPPRRTPSPAAVVNARGTQSPTEDYSRRIFGELAALIDSSRAHPRDLNNTHTPSPNKPNRATGKLRISQRSWHHASHIASQH